MHMLRMKIKNGQRVVWRFETSAPRVERMHFEYASATCGQKKIFNYF